jgi:HEAT repeat protein
MVWKRKMPAWVGLIVFAVLSFSASGKNPASEPNPSSSQKEILEAQISVLIMKRSWPKVLEYGISSVEPLIQALKDNDEGIRVESVEALEIIGDKRAVGPLIESLKDKDRRVRQKSVRALGKLGGNQAVEPIAGCLNDTSREVRLEAVEALKELADPWAFKYLVKSLRDSDVSVRKETVKALLMTGGKRSVEPFLEYLKDPDSKSKVEVIRALGVLGDKRSVELMISFLKDNDPAVRMWSVEALRRIGDDRAVEPLKKCLDDPDQSVSGRAAEALNKFQMAAKSAEAAKPATMAKVDKKVETPVLPPPVKVSIPVKDQPGIKEQAAPLETIKEARTSEKRSQPAEIRKKASYSWMIYGIIVIAAVILIFAGFKFAFARRKTKGEIIRELDILSSEIREISRKKTNDSVKDSALNLLEAHATVFGYFPLDADSNDVKSKHLAIMDDSIAAISGSLGAGHRGIKLLHKMRKIVKKAMDNGCFDSPSVSGDAKLKNKELDGSGSDVFPSDSFNPERSDAPKYVMGTVLPQLTKSLTHCVKCGCTVPPAGPAADEALERRLLEESKPQQGIMALKSQGGGEFLLRHLKKHGVGLFCSQCPTAWCPSCVNPLDPSTCSICGGTMIIYRKK